MELRDPRSVPQLKVALGRRSRLRRKPRLWPSADIRQGFRGAVRREGVTEAAREGGASPQPEPQPGWARQTCGQSHRPEEQGGVGRGRIEALVPWLKPGLGPPGAQDPAVP